MKNLYLLATNKPSRLHDYNYISLLGLSKEYLQWRQGMHIYITCNERIKERDWKICLNDNLITKYLSKKSIESDIICRDCRKIILTTDPELIEDGVQLISDKFLEWFVKNPSCEFAEYDKSYNRGNGKYYYKVITPKEKVKHEARVLSKEEVMSGRSSAYEFIDFSRQSERDKMTSDRIKEIQKQTAYPESVSVKQALLTVWNECEQYKKYSEEEVISILVEFSAGIKNISNITEWFEQIKK